MGLLLNSKLHHHMQIFFYSLVFKKKFIPLFYLKLFTIGAYIKSFIRIICMNYNFERNSNMCFMSTVQLTNFDFKRNQKFFLIKNLHIYFLYLIYIIHMY